MPNKNDIAQFRAAWRKCGLTPEQGRRFSEWVHQLKAEGVKGSKPNGDFEWQELLDLCEQFKRETDL